LLENFFEQLAKAMEDDPQLWVRANCPGFLPVSKIEVIDSVVLPVLFTDIDSTIETRFSAWLPNSSEAGDKA